MNNSMRITQTAATVAQLMGFSMAKEADQANEAVLQAAGRQFGGAPVERVLLYNPDAVAMWLYQKYTRMFAPVISHTNMALPVYSQMPSVTPVCFASMYSGLTPAQHGIQAYRKPVLQVQTLYDAAIASGHRPVIISEEKASISCIFLERDMEYILCKTSEECNEAALQVLEEDRFDIVEVYNGNYDATMHRYGPEAPESLEKLAANVEAFCRLKEKAAQVWAGKRSMAAFLPDHGCHEIDGGLGSHGLDMEEDMNIMHFYGFF